MPEGVRLLAPELEGQVARVLQERFVGRETLGDAMLAVIFVLLVAPVLLPVVAAVIDAVSMHNLMDELEIR